MTILSKRPMPWDVASQVQGSVIAAEVTGIYSTCHLTHMSVGVVHPKKLIKSENHMLPSSRFHLFTLRHNIETLLQPSDVLFVDHSHDKLKMHFKLSISSQASYFDC